MRCIYIDFETTNISPLKAEIIEFCALFVEDYNIVDKHIKFVKFEKDWDSLEKSDISALNFNKIFTKEDLDKHNQKSSDLKEVLNEFLDKVKLLGFDKVMIGGWNNAIYDCVILRRVLERFEIDYMDFFDYHARDVCSMFIPFFEIEFSSKLSKLSLHQTHKFLFGTIKDEDFHKAENDCRATLDIDKWIFGRISKVE